MAKNAIGMAIACEEYGAKFFANGATPGGILEDPGTVRIHRGAETVGLPLLAAAPISIR